MNDWPKVRLGKLYEVHNGLSKPREAFGSGWPFLSYSVVFNNFFVPESLDSLVQTTDKEQESYSIRAGDIFVTRTSETANELGMSCVALKDYPRATYNGFCKRLRPITDRVYPRYIGYFMRTQEFRGHLAGLGASMITRASLRNEDLLSIPVPLPPLDTQRAIAERLAAYDNLIENNNRRIALLEKKAEGLYKEWFVRYRFPGHEKAKWVGDLPEGWKKVALEAVAEITMGQSPESCNYNSTGNGLPFHQGVTGFRQRFPVNEVWCTCGKRFAEAGDILFSVRAPVGRINIASERIVIGRGLSAFKSKSGNQSWLFYLLKDTFRKEDMIGSGSIFASTTKKELFGVKVILPTVNLIRDFEERSISVDLLLANLQKQNALLAKKRDLLLPRLMSGRMPPAEQGAAKPEQGAAKPRGCIARGDAAKPQSRGDASPEAMLQSRRIGHEIIHI